MVTDPLFYRLFATSPETFFLLLGMPPDAAREMAARYEYQAIEFKETSHRTDGVFLPKEPVLPIYFLEVQFYGLASVFADLLVKAYTYLKQNNPAQPFRGIVLFASRSLEPVEVTPYRALLDAGVVQRYYLDELPELPGAPLGFSILHLIGQAEDEAATLARDLVARAKTEIADTALQSDLVELIETVIIYKLRRFSRQEIQAMLQISDLRDTRVYQEALEEGREEGLEKGREQGLEKGREQGLEAGLEAGKREQAVRGIINMAKKPMPLDEIAALLEVDIAFVRQVLTERTSG